MAIVEVGCVGRGALLALARRLDGAGRGVALLDGEGWGGVVLGVGPLEERRVDLDGEGLVKAACAMDEIAGAGARWIGYVAYESARPSIERPQWVAEDRRPAPFGAAAIFRRFGAVARWNAIEGRTFVEGDDAASVRRLCDELRAEEEASPPPIDLRLRPTDRDDDHRARVVAAIDLIARGHVYVVNLARLYEGTCDAPATAILDALHRRGRSRYGAAIDFGDHVVASASPERFLEVRGRRVITSPIKGTRPRGVDAESDRAQIESLARDPKEIAELTMVVDLERNDLGRVAKTGSVRVLGEPRIETTATVHHRVHDVTAILRQDASLGDLLRATLPSGSVTGAPKVRAMEIIATLEPTRRGLYCGAILSLDDKGNLVASMAIRTVVRQGDVARYHAGGGIVADSDPDREVAETGWKARPATGS